MNRALQVQIGKIRNFLYSQKCKRFLVFLFFLSVSAGFWLLQTLNETLEVKLRIPLQLQGVPKTAVLTLEPPSDVEVTLRDRGTVLTRYLYRSTFAPLAVDFSKYDKGAVNDRVIVPKNDVQQLLQAQLSSSTRVQKITPDTIEYYYNRGLAYRLPVKVVGSVKTTAQNYLNALQCYPDSVELYAPTHVMDTMRYAYTNEVSWEGLTESVAEEVGLHPIKGVKYNTPSVQVKALVDYYIEKTIEVPIEGINFPADKMLRAFPSKAKVTFRVGAAHSNRKWEDAFVLVVSYEELLNNENSKYHLRLKSQPSDVSHVRIVPADVDYLIEHKASEEE